MICVNVYVSVKSLLVEVLVNEYWSADYAERTAITTA